jgi:hypothetical protein
MALNSDQPFIRRYGLHGTDQAQAVQFLIGVVLGMTRHRPVRGVKSRPELAVSGRGAQRMLPCGNRVKARRVGPRRRGDALK